MLRSLELFGFKSFADRTIFEFSAGITGVVGPNGSGKSNVVDSIKWVLGDQSPRSLRGREMTDVIFNGSSGRGPAQFAEATLVFDNRSRFLPLDQDEVSVGRRLWQSGDSEYLINRSTARLKDVRELFSGTGAGAAAYCIIEQGRVDQILQSNAANRRLIFEEAAGIARFRSRRADAVRRLDRVEQNLLRLTDIVDEVESQVSSVRSQAQRAVRYREVSAELETLWVGMVCDDFRRQILQESQLTEQKDAAAAALKELEEQRRAAEIASAEAETALNAADAEIRQMESERAVLRSRISSLETSGRHDAARQTELETDAGRLRRQLSVMNRRVVEAEQERRNLAHMLDAEENRLQAMRRTQEHQAAELDALRQQMTDAEQQMESCRSEVAELVQQKTAVSGRMDVVRSQRETLKRREKEIQDAHILQQQEREQLLNRLAERQQAEKAAQQALQEAQQHADRLLSDRDMIVRHQSESRESLTELREQRSAAEARRSVLEDLEDRQEGFGIGVREILRRAEESRQSPWNLIRGSVADLLDVDMDHAALLEVALSGRAQLLVIDRLDPLIEYLSSGRCRMTGRVGFVSLENAPIIDADRRHAEASEESVGAADLPADGLSENDPLRLPDFDVSLPESFDGDIPEDVLSPELNVTWVDAQADTPIRQSVFSHEEIPSLTGQPGVIGRADSLARSPRRIPHLAALLLADTWVVETLADAVRIVKQSQGRVRAVTPQGELVECDGTLHTGMVRSETAVVSRKSELRRLKNELHRLQHLVQERELLLERLSADVDAADTELESARNAIASAADRLRAVVEDRAEIQQSLSFAEQRLERLQEQMTTVRNDLAGVDAEIEDLEKQQTAGEDSLTACRNRLLECERQRDELRSRLDTLERNRNETALQVTRMEERVISVRDAVDRIDEDLDQRRLQQQEARRRLGAGQDRLREIRLSRLNVGAELSELYVQEDRLQSMISTRTADRQRLQVRRQEAARQEAGIRDQCARQERRHHELELRISQITHQRAAAAERIYDEFQIRVEDAVAEGRSALAAWLTAVRTAEAAADHPENAADVSVPRITADSEEVASVLHDAARYEELRRSIEQRVDRLRRQMRKIGSVSTESLDSLAELETRYERLHSQLHDLEAARDALRSMVRKIDVECRRMFLESFECIQTHFRELFRRLFGGGEADLVLDDPENVLECAIDVVARPPGKELRSLSLLSGGEKTLTAVALLLAIFRSRPSPFCLLDEVDAALDDANISRFVGVLRDFRDDTQFIMITHRKPTMAVTDVLYGVTMQESGVSRRLSVRFEEIDEQGNFLPRDANTSRAA